MLLHPLQRAPLDVNRGDPLHSHLVVRVEARHEGAIQIENAENLAVSDQRDNQFGPGRRVAGDMTRKRMDVLDQDRVSALNSGAANAATDSNAEARRLALERAQDELVAVAQEIKAGPIDVRKQLEQQSGGVRR